MKLNKSIKIVTLICLIFSCISINVFALDNSIKAPLIFEDFENSDSTIAATNEATVNIIDGHANNDGKKVAQLEIKSSDWPSITHRSMTVKKQTPVDVSSYKYLTLWIKENNANSVRISLIDENGKYVEGEWSENVTAGQWTQVFISLDKFSSLDLTKITGIYIGEWNSGTYLIDDICFSDLLAKDLVLNSNVPTGTYHDAFEVTLSANDNQSIYYTTDGTTPTKSSTLYTQPISIDEDCTLKAIVCQTNYVSMIYEFNYKIDHEDTSNYTPVLVQAFENDVNVTSSPDATYQITNEQAHQGKKSLKYTKATSEGTSKDKGNLKIDFMHPVNVSDLKYLIFYIKDTQGSNTMQISLIDEDGNESGYDWRNPSTVKNQWSQYYVKLSDISGIDKTKVSAIRLGQWNAGDYYIDDIYFDNFLSSGVPEAKPSQPQSNIASGYQFKNELDITLENNTNADIYYTIDGSEPSKDTLHYDKKIHLEQTTTIKAVSYDHGIYSDIAEFKYVKNENILPDITVNKMPGKYTKPINVSLTTLHGNIYYTLDGSEPTDSSNLYQNPIAIDKTTTIKAVVYDQGQAGNIITLDYKYPSAPKQVYASTNETRFNSATQIELISDPDATIYYTTDGTEPTNQSKVAEGYLSISKTMTVKAIAIRDGYSSDITTLSYVIAPQAVKADKEAGTYSGSVLIEFRVPDSDQVKIYYTTDGSEPTIKSTAYVKPITVDKNTTFKVAATYKNSDSLSEVTTHQYIINPIEQAVAPIITPDSGTYGQRQQITMKTETQNGTIYYTLDGSTPTQSSQQYSGSFYVNKDTTIKAVTVKDGHSSDVTVNEIKITNEKSPFLKTDGSVIRNNYGGGEIVQLKGTNIGGWLVMENWQCPVNSPDQKTTLSVLTNRFGKDKAWELINIYQDNWFTANDFKILKEEGVNCLRLPITYFEMCNDDGTLKESAFQRLDWFIENASKYEIYTLIDMHGAFGSQNGKDHSGDISNPDVGHFFDNESNINKTIELWKAIAKRYKNNAWVAGYDLLNEPGGAVGTTQFEVYDRIYDAIRAIDQNHIIQMQAIWEPTHLPDPSYYHWENVVYQYHFYGWDVEKDAEGQKAFIESKVKYLEEADFNIPVFVGEFTFFSNEQSWDYGLEIFNEQGWSYTSWTYKVSGDNSSWGMYTMPDNANTKVDIYKDDYNTIKQKWSSFEFTRNNKFADKLAKYMKASTTDTAAPVITGKDNVVEIDCEDEITTILDLFVKDEHDGVINNENLTITTEYNPHVAGTYQVLVKATDQSQNSSEKTFTITVKQKQDITVTPNDPDSQPDQDHQTTASENTSNSNVQTGDDQNIISYFIFMIISLGGFIITRKKFKKS